MISSVLSPNGQVLSEHPFTRPQIRLWLPILMTLPVLACGLAILPTVQPLEIVGLMVLMYVAISACVPICEITVTERGLIIHRLILRERFIPWSSIDRVLIYTHVNSRANIRLEIASIGIYEGLSPFQRLPGLLYGQGLRQTVIVTPEAVQDYESLIEALAQRCAVFRTPRSV